MSKLKTIVSLFIISANSCFAASPFFPKLVVTGTSQLHKPADQFGLTITVLSQAETAESALADNNEKMQKVIDSLQIAGLEKGEYHTGQFSIQPIYSTPPRIMPENWKAQIISYEVNNSVNVKTQKLDFAPSIIDAAGSSGASQIANISFGLKDSSIYRSEAISQATANAIKDAETLAQAANLQIVRVLDVKLDQPQIYSRPGHNMLYMAKESAPFIEAPDVDVSASVTVTFEIASKG